MLPIKISNCGLRVFLGSSEININKKMRTIKSQINDQSCSALKTRYFVNLFVMGRVNKPSLKKNKR